jgi:hypothetical protein
LLKIISAAKVQKLCQLAKLVLGIPSLVIDFDANKLIIFLCCFE